MARVTFSKEKDTTVNNSPGGFWSPPGGKSTPLRQNSTWEVPQRRKTRDKLYKNMNYFVDVEKNDICYMNSGEITTKNRFEALEDHNTKTSKPQEKNESSCNNQEQIEEKKPFIFCDFNTFVKATVNLNSKEYKLNNYNIFVNNNKNSLNTGYYPDIIFLETDDFSNTYDFNNKDNPFMYNGKPIRQVSNPHSRFNNRYYLNMRSAHKISQHIFNGPSPSSSRGTRDTSIGTKGEWNIVNRRKYVRRHGETHNKSYSTHINYNVRGNNSSSINNKVPQGRVTHISTTIPKGLAEYTATPEGEYTPTATSGNPAEYTADTHYHMRENPNGEYTPKDSQRRVYTQKKGQSIYNQRPNWQNNNNNINNLKYYNQNNSSKNPKSYSSKFSCSNTKVVV